MILYLDSSALVKRYVFEPGTEQINEAIFQADLIGTVLVSKVEVTAALAKAVRMEIVDRGETTEALRVFKSEWLDFVRVQVTEIIVARAEILAWEHNLRGYDALHLAAAVLWSEAIGESVTMATFDQGLWSAAGQVGLIAYPEDLKSLILTWKRKRD
jgi:predicted nucleic acid-binding protein